MCSGSSTIIRHLTSELPSTSCSSVRILSSIVQLIPPREFALLPYWFSINYALLLASLPPTVEGSWGEKWKAKGKKQNKSITSLRSKSIENFPAVFFSLIKWNKNCFWQLERLFAVQNAISTRQRQETSGSVRSLTRTWDSKVPCEPNKEENLKQIKFSHEQSWKELKFTFVKSKKAFLVDRLLQTIVRSFIQKPSGKFPFKSHSNFFN